MKNSIKNSIKNDDFIIQVIREVDSLLKKFNDKETNWKISKRFDLFEIPFSNVLRLSLSEYEDLDPDIEIKFEKIFEGRPIEKPIIKFDSYRLHELSKVKDSFKDSIIFSADTDNLISKSFANSTSCSISLKDNILEITAE